VWPLLRRIQYYLPGVDPVKPLIGLAFGGSLISDLRASRRRHFHQGCGRRCRPGGKVEAGHPEDDRRNPAVIPTTSVTTSGDCAHAADLFETYAVTIIATMLLGGLMLKGFDNAISLPAGARRRFHPGINRRHVLRVGDQGRRS